MSKNFKKKRLKESALLRAKQNKGIDTTNKNITPPAGSVIADHAELKHNNTYGLLPLFYVDKLIVCRDCGKEEVWKAERQKWWYEIAKGNINTRAVYCRDCRYEKKAVKIQARKVHLERIAKKYGKPSR